MEQIVKLIIGIAVLFLGVPIGNALARATSEELYSGKKWFRLIIILSLVISIIGLINKNDFVLFSFLFTAIVTSRSLAKVKTGK